MWLYGVLLRIIQGIKILPLSLQYIFSLLLFVVSNRDYFLSVYIITTIVDEEMIYTCLRYLCPNIRREFIIQASKSVTVFPRQLRTSPASLISLKVL